MAAPSPPSMSYWCYQCIRAVHVTFGIGDDVVCRHCGGGFVQALASPGPGSPHMRRRNPAQPLIVLPSSSRPSDGDEGGGDRAYELYYDFGDGLGPRPLPPAMSDLLIGPDFEPMLERVMQMGFSVWARPETLPASKAAVASLPTVEIVSSHVESELECAVCKDEFALRSEALEMPCKHLYHPGCIHPWLTRHNTCPVCRHELPGDDPYGIPGRPGEVALAIWRLPGGGIGVGRFMGGQPEPPPEFNGRMAFVGEVPREIRWGPGMRRPRFGRARQFFGSIVRRVVGCASGGAPDRRSRSFSDSDTGSLY